MELCLEADEEELIVQRCVEGMLSQRWSQI
jgi:hypothetical protein